MYLRLRQMRPGAPAPLLSSLGRDGSGVVRPGGSLAHGLAVCVLREGVEDLDTGKRG